MSDIVSPVKSQKIIERRTDEALVVHAVGSEVLDLSMTKNACGKTAEGCKSQLRGRFHFCKT